jgi:CheY-like chemotaxis protein
MVLLVVILVVVLVLVMIWGGREVYQRSVRLRNRLQMERVFTNISHELLTPLTVISASVERLREQEPRFKSDYALMELNIDRMVHLLQELLETSKAQSGELKLLVSQGDVMQYISQTALCLRPLMLKRNISFTIQCEPKSMMGWIDTDKLDKIIYNLLSNAAKYTPENGTVTLLVNTNRNYDRIIIKVIDSGIGISASRMKQLFHPFVDGDYRQMHTIGTGLGLALTRDLVYLHGGSIKCDSQEGTGTTFTVSLPINKEAFSKAQIDESHQASPMKPQSYISDLEELLPRQETLQAKTLSESADEDTYRILLVEDNAELLMVMGTLLSKKYQIRTAANGVQALEVIQKEDIDLIISDVMMPEMDGNELTRRVKASPNYSHLPIILLTAKTSEEDRKEAIRIGADDFITKPFKMGDLELRINNIIENRQRIRREFKSQTIEESRLKNQLTSSNPDEEFLRKAIDCVYAHLADTDFDRDAFASEMGASASTLYNKLRSITGLNVSAFIRDIRMKESKRMAQVHPDLRVSDLAYKVGFKDPKYFATCFKKEFGLQPSEYLEQMAKQ